MVVSIIGSFFYVTYVDGAIQHRCGSAMVDTTSEPEGSDQRKKFPAWFYHYIRQTDAQMANAQNKVSILASYWG